MTCNDVHVTWGVCFLSRVKHELELAFAITKTNRLSIYVIFPDSLSALSKLNISHYTQYDLFTLPEVGQVVSFWIREHAGISGCDLADSIAKLTCFFSPWTLPSLVPYHLLQNYVPLEQYVVIKRTKRLPVGREWETKFSKRRNQIFIYHMCTGHSLIIHFHLMDADMGAFAHHAHNVTK